MSPPLQVTLYRKVGCGLCDQAEAMLARIARDTPLAVTTVDIDADPALQARYFLEIPVVAVDGAHVARAPISELALRAQLRAAAAG
jgi:hypothetical protein